MNSTNDKIKFPNWVKDLIPLLSTIVVVSGWYIVNCYNISRDIEYKKRELTTEYLINAYRAISAYAGRSSLVLDDELLVSNEDIKRINDLEQAIADIQLFGDSYQRGEIASICKKAEPTKSKDTSGRISFSSKWESNDLQRNLRKELRKELKLKEIPIDEDVKGIQWLRWSLIIEETKKSNKLLERNQTPKEK